MCTDSGIACLSHLYSPLSYFLSFFFNDTATTEIYTLSLHDALPICPRVSLDSGWSYTRTNLDDVRGRSDVQSAMAGVDRKSTRLNSSHSQISYAVFCLKKKKNKTRS